MLLVFTVIANKCTILGTVSLAINSLSSGPGAGVQVSRFQPRLPLTESAPYVAAI
jgi:hypothetical protein